MSAHAFRGLGGVAPKGIEGFAIKSGIRDDFVESEEAAAETSPLLSFCGSTGVGGGGK